MRHKVAGKSLSRNSAHRAALRKNFTVSVIKHERVVTTLAKAKALRPFVEKMITLARRANDKNGQEALRRDRAALRQPSGWLCAHPALARLPHR
jgi:large subunit ribosomal protein L17